MAALPASDFDGYDISKHALTLAAKNLAEAGLTNVTFHDAAAERLPADGRFDFITGFDCIHDMTHPTQVLGATRKAIKDDGTLLIADVNGRPTYAENTADNPRRP